jgi:hypothetical protein
VYVSCRSSASHAARMGRAPCAPGGEKCDRCSDRVPLDLERVPHQHADAWRGSGWCNCSRPCPRSHAHGLPSALATPILIIAAQEQCFNRTSAIAQAAGFVGSITRIHASFVGVDVVTERCCPKGFCGKGSRLKPNSRAVMDGGMQAHRGVWRRVLEARQPHVVLEDDVRHLGSHGP